MTTFLNHNLLGDLLTIYDRVMLLKVFVDNDTELYNKYCEAAHNHNNKIMNNPHIIDAGFDLFAPQNEGNEIRFFGSYYEGETPINKLDYKICCSAQMATDKNKMFNTGFYMYPRSSISKIPLRLANSTGIIDAGYRGHLIGMFDIKHVNVNVDKDILADYFGNKFDRYVQICAPGLVPILVVIVNSMEELGEQTERGSGGFGSTGV